MSAFASKSIPVHLTRGLAAVLAFVFAFQAVVGSPWLALGAVLAGFWLLRGCPICWTIGLFETIAGRQAEQDAGLAVIQAAEAEPTGQAADAWVSATKSDG